MSAFVVSSDTIDAIVEFAISSRLITREEADATGAMLLRENVRSVNFRYSTRDKVPSYTFREGFLPPSRVQVLKACHCLDYQSCEHDGYRKSKAYRFIRDVAYDATPSDAIAGYDRAAWDI